MKKVAEFALGVMCISVFGLTHCSSDTKTRILADAVPDTEVTAMPERQGDEEVNTAPDIRADAEVIAKPDARQDGEVQTDGGTDTAACERAGDSETGFREPTFWHHYHANSRNTDHIAGIESPTRLEQVWAWPERTTVPERGPDWGVSSFNGAALSPTGDRIYITSGAAGHVGLFALEAAADSDGATRGVGKVCWKYTELDAWCSFSSALVDNCGVVYVADREKIVALQPPSACDEANAQPQVLWQQTAQDIDGDGKLDYHNHTSMSLGFTPWGDLFEITIEGQVAVFDRATGANLAYLDLRKSDPTGSNLLIPIGVGTPDQVKTSPPLLGDAYGVAIHNPINPRQERNSQCRWVWDDDSADETGLHFLQPAQMSLLWERVGAQNLLSKDVPDLLQRFFDTSFGGTYNSNTPSIVRLGDSQQAHIFVPTLATYTRPVLPNDPLLAQFTDDILLKAFYRAEEWPAADDPQRQDKIAAMLAPYKPKALARVKVQGRDEDRDDRIYAVDPVVGDVVDPTLGQAASHICDTITNSAQAPQVEYILSDAGATPPDPRQPFLYPIFGRPYCFDPPGAGADTPCISYVPTHFDGLVDGATVEEKQVAWDTIEHVKRNWLKFTHGYLSAYLQAVLWNHETRSLSVALRAPLPSPSGTSPAISDPIPGSDIPAMVFFASGSKLYAFDVGAPNMPPFERWSWDAGLPVGGSPTVFDPDDLGANGVGGGPAVMVLAGFRGVAMVQDRPLGDGACAGQDGDDPLGLCCGDLHKGTRGRCNLVWTANPQPYEERDPEQAPDARKTRRERYLDNEQLTLAVGSSVPEAGRQYAYVAFTKGPANDTFYDEHGIGNWDDFIPIDSLYAVVRTEDGQILDRLVIDEAPVCDSTVDTDWVYAIHTSGLDQIKHSLYPTLFRRPTGGILAFKRRLGE